MKHLKLFERFQIDKTREILKDKIREKLFKMAESIPERDIFHYIKDNGNLPINYKPIDQVIPNVTKYDYWLSTKAIFTTCDEEEWNNVGKIIHDSLSRDVYKPHVQSSYKINNGFLYRKSGHWHNVGTCSWSTKLPSGNYALNYRGVAKVKLSEMTRKSNSFVLTIDSLIDTPRMLKGFAKHNTDIKYLVDELYPEENKELIYKRMEKFIIDKLEGYEIEENQKYPIIYYKRNEETLLSYNKDLKTLWINYYLIYKELINNFYIDIEEIKELLKTILTENLNIEINEITSY